MSALQGNKKKLLRAAGSTLLAMTIIVPYLAPTQKVQADELGYYVGGANASDSNPGTSAEPFATIQKAASVAAAGDTVLIRSGTYRETVTPANSGAEGSPIVYQPDGDAVVTISGADAADGGWSVYQGNIYQKTISLPVNGYNDHMTTNDTLMANQVFVDGKMMIEARWPNLPNSDDLMNRADWREASNGTWATVGAGMSVDDAAIPNIEGGWIGGQMWMTGWFIPSTAQITAQTGTKLTLSKNTSEAFRDYYYLTGKLGALDSAKEWFYDGTKLYLWAPDGNSPTNVEVKKRNYAFDLNSKSNISINNIHVEAASLVTNGSSSNITIDGLKAKYINHSVTLPGPDLTYSHIDETGIRLIGEGSSIKNSVIEYSSGAGIVLGAGNSATNNLVHDIAYDGTYASGIVPKHGTGSQTITHNTIYRTGRSSIDLYNNLNVEIGYNDMYDYGLANMDLGAVYSSRSSDLTGTRIHHNWIHDNKAPYNIPDTGIQTGIYLDQGSGPAQADHNVLWNNMIDYYNQHEFGEGKPLKIFNTYNNTFGSMATASYTTYTSPAIDVNQNNIHRDAILSVDNAINTIRQKTDPKFVNEGHGGLKYRLKAESPAVDHGGIVAGVTDGFVGTAPDIGAYELGGDEWVPGYTADGYVPAYYATEQPLEPTPQPPTPPPVLGMVTIDDAETGTGELKYEFVGTWNSSANDKAYMETDHYNNKADDYYQVKFTGTHIRVYGEKNNGFGIAAVSIDGGPETLVDTYSATRSVNTLLFSSEMLSLGSHTLKVRLTGEKNASSGGNWVTADRVVVTTGTVTVDDNETGTGLYKYEFVGGWNLSPNDQAYMQTDHFSGTTNDYYQVKFNGTQIQVYGEKNSSFSIAAFSIDGGEETLVDSYSATRIVDTLLYTSAELPKGEHTLKVRLTGTKNVNSGGYWHTADKVVVILGSVDAQTTTVDDDDTGTDENQYEFVGSWNASANLEAYLQTDHFSGTANDYYQVRFTGTQIEMYGEKNNAFGIIAASIDGGPEVLIDLYNPTRLANTLLYTSHTLSNGSHSLKVRITGLKNTISNGTYTTADRVVITTSDTEPAQTLTFDDTDTGTDENQYEFVGTWNASANGQAYLETDHFNATTNDYYQFKFTGTQVKVYGEKNDAFGIIAVSVDGGLETLVDLYNVSRNANTLLYTSPGLPLEQHTVKVRITGKKNENSGGTYTTADRVVITTSGAIDEPTPTTVPAPEDPTDPTDPTDPPVPTPESAPDPGVIYEAETAALVGGTALATNHIDYTGTGFVDSFNGQGAAVTFTVNTFATVTKDVTLRYANGDSDIRSLSVYLNGVKIKQTSLMGTGGWDSWGYKSEQLVLQAGVNTITYKYDAGDTGAVNVDNISIPLDANQEHAPGMKYEAELATLTGNVKENTDHAGYSGTGFVDSIHGDGPSIGFAVHTAAAGSKDVTIRYADGDDDRTLSIYVNGTKLKQVHFSGTGNWDTWGNRTVKLTLAEGDNTIVIKKDEGDTGLINIDYISIAGEEVVEPEPAIPFVIVNGSLIGKKGFTAAVTVKPVGQHAGNEIIVFELTKKNGKKTIKTVAKDIITEQQVSVVFNENGQHYTVKVYVKGEDGTLLSEASVFAQNE
ncbi:CBM35 domain-containing protein [Paenibacillus sp. CF384]|uniref:CBM35 domain-containing protein n=1 Tax=Paenibacillus sp. CF384 TaxID=1884382 RepID=UPI000896975E|nr:CBM35 domain-containing protein [Paenibacillus sp. CF384]SDX37931.1 Protein of unknown function [Paenibacillus sp. CF384]